MMARSSSASEGGNPDEARVLAEIIDCYREIARAHGQSPDDVTAVLPAREEVLSHLPDGTLKTVLSTVDDSIYSGMIRGVVGKGKGKTSSRLRRSMLGRLSSSTAIPLKRGVTVIECYKHGHTVPADELVRAVAEQVEGGNDVVVKVNPPFVPAAYAGALDIVGQVKQSAHVREGRASVAMAFSAASLVRADEEVNREHHSHHTAQLSQLQGQLNAQSQQVAGQLESQQQSIKSMFDSQMAQIRGLLAKRPREDGE